MPVDSERLTQHISTLAAAPRPTGSQELEQARNYVVQQFSGVRLGRHAASV